MDRMGKRIFWKSGGKLLPFAGGDSDLFQDPALDRSATQDYAEGKPARSRQGKRLIEIQGEFNPDEVTKEMMEK